MLSQDKTLAVLKAGVAVPRKARKATEVTVYLETGRYTVQVNHKTVASAAGDEATARRDARERADKLSKLLRMPVTVTIY